MNYKKHILVRPSTGYNWIYKICRARVQHTVYGKEPLFCFVCLFFCAENSSATLITLANVNSLLTSCMQYMYQFTLQVDLSFYQSIRCKVFRMKCEYILAWICRTHRIWRVHVFLCEQNTYGIMWKKQTPTQEKVSVTKNARYYGG